jgi:putative effector of murein hydrolase LrgA (UPF0299 family)
MIVKNDLLETQSPVSFPVPPSLITLAFMSWKLEAKRYASGANPTQKQSRKARLMTLHLVPKTIGILGILRLMRSNFFQVVHQVLKARRKSHDFVRHSMRF